MEELLYFIGYSLVTVLITWSFKRKYQMQIVSIACLIFVGYLDWVSFIVLVSSSLGTYFLLHKSEAFSKVVLIATSGLIGIFIYFKLKATIDDGMFSVALPLGLSFYYFRLLHYVIEVYKGHLKETTLRDFLSFMFYLPVILIGPIIRFADWQKEVKRRRWDPQLFSGGLERILYGLVKSVVLGNYIFSSRLPYYISKIQIDQPWLANYLDSLCYTGNSYMQFAGYSDIAIGISMLLGIRVMENFNYPFLAKNINDFWKRWHISLSQWCRDYIFMPIASYSRLAWLAILSSMLILGLWHEFSSRYILWALFHGLGIVIWHFFDKYVTIDLKGGWRRIYDAVCVFITFNFVIVSFVWVKETSFADSIEVFKILLGF
jgi:alginate O-acetyltransferase complex protein AlgI